jgi:hypothetical protein
VILYPIPRLAELYIVAEPDGFWAYTSDEAWNKVLYHPVTKKVKKAPDIYWPNLPDQQANDALDLAVTRWTSQIKPLFPHGNPNTLVVRTGSHFTLLDLVPDGWNLPRGLLLTPAVSLDGLTGATVIEQVADNRIHHQLLVFDMP